MAPKIGVSLVLDGEKQYREAIKGIKNEQSELRSEMKLCQNAFQNNQNSLDALQKKYEIQTKQIDTVKEKQDVYTKAVADYTEKQEKAAEKVGLLQTELTNAESKMKEMQGSTDSTKEAVEEQAKAIEDLKKKLGDAESNYDSAGQKITYYQTCLNYAEIELAEMQKELDKTEGYIKEAEDATDGCATSINEFGKETVDASGKTTIFGDVLKANLMSEALVSGIKAIASGIKEISESALESGSNFEAAMSKTEALSGATGSELETLTTKAKQMGASTMFSASQSAEAFQYMALAGWKTGEMLEGIEPIMNLAAAADLDLAKASDIVTDYLTAFGLEAKDAEKFVDQMAYTMASSNTSAEQLGEAYKGCAATAASMGYSVEETTAVLATMANAGVKGGEAGTALSAIMTRLATNTSECADKLKGYGIYVYNTKGEMNSLSSILNGVSDVWGTLSQEQQANVAKAIAGTNHYSKLQTIMSGCSEAAEKTGKSFNDYAEALNVCDGASKRMADTMQDNLKGKITILQSALEGLGIASYECFDEELKKGVDGAADAVSRLTRSVESGDLGVSIRNLSRAFGDLVEGAVDFGEDALPVVIDALTWLLDNSDLVAAGVTGIAAANMKMKVVGPAVEAAQAAWMAYKKANEGATVSQWLLNTAMNANPAGIIVTAIVGLTAAVAAYTIANKDSFKIIDEVSERTKELAEDSRALNEELGKATSERAGNREGMEAQAEVCRKLSEELKELQSKTGLTTEEQTRQKMIVEQLNQAMPELNLAINEQTGLINMSTKALDNNIESMMALAKAEAAREDLYKIAEDQYEAEKNLVKLREQMEEQTRRVEEAEKDYNDALENNRYAEGSYAYAMSLKEETEVLGQAREAQAELQAQIDATSGSIEGFKEEYIQTTEYISDTEAQTQAAAATAELGDTAEDVGGKFAGMSQAAQEALAEMQTSLVETISNQMDIFSEFDGKMKLTTDELLNNMQSQVDGITQWADNIAELAGRGIDQGLLRTLEEMGPAGAGYVATFVEMTDEELKKANELFEKSLSVPTEAAEKATESYVEAGKMAGEGYAIGIEETIEKVGETSTKAAQESLDCIDKTLEINSLSKKTKQSGIYAAEGLAVGMEEEKPNVINVIENICNEIIGTSQNLLKTSTFANIGKQIPAGLESGIRSGKSGVIKAVQEMCTEAVNTAMNALEIHSTSKKYEYMGKMSGEGYALGWEKSMANVNAVIEASLPPNMSISQMNGVLQESPHKEILKEITIPQEINIYAMTDDLLETSRKFKETMREVARDW